MHQAHSTIVLGDKDNVAIALKAILKDDSIGELGLSARTDIPKGHKVAKRAIPSGEAVFKYGQIIGRSTKDISAGEHVHTHNIEFTDHKSGYEFSTEVQNKSSVADNAEFLGYQRDDGTVGTRNYIGILTSVNCSGSVAKFVAEEAEKSGLLKRYKNVDGVVPIVHGSGCGMANSGEGYDLLFRTLSGYARNPNFAAILLIGLGCEVMQITDLVGKNRLQNEESFRYMTIQSEGGTSKTIERGMSTLTELLEYADQSKRQPSSVSKLTVGLQCGGSDGYSGITANPALGVASDILVQHGGISILSETPEIYGAEHLLTRRALTEEIGKKLLDRISWWENYTARNGGEMNNNPSPGNKRGGLTTILEKSLGAVAKGGVSPLAGVFEYGEKIDTHGFVYMDSPGYDPCSVTGQIASGANIIVFTTGRGSVSGYKPSPCIKLSTNTGMYRRMSGDIDLDCGDIIENGVTLEEKGKQIFEQIVRVASGQKTKSEELGFGGSEFVPWQIGAVM
jgi:altronate hydrolase/galactarate dehydratase